MKKIFTLTAAVLAAVSVYADKTWNFSDWDNNSGLKNGVYNGLGVYACSPDATTQINNMGVVEASEASFTAAFGDDAAAFTKRFKFNGNGVGSDATSDVLPTQRYVYFDVEPGLNTLKIWWRTGGSGARTLVVSDGTKKLGELTIDKSTADNGDKGLLKIENFVVTARTRIYIYCLNGTNNLYQIDFKGTLAEIETGIQETMAEAGVRYNGNVILNEARREMTVFNALGKMVASTTEDFNMSQMPAGVYVVRVAGINGALKIRK